MRCFCAPRESPRGERRPGFRPPQFPLPGTGFFRHPAGSPVPAVSWECSGRGSVSAPLFHWREPHVLPPEGGSAPPAVRCAVPVPAYRSEVPLLRRLPLQPGASSQCSRRRRAVSYARDSAGCRSFRVQTSVLGPPHLRRQVPESRISSWNTSPNCSFSGGFGFSSPETVSIISLIWFRQPLSFDTKHMGLNASELRGKINNNC